jgi:arginine/lysine/ornithine decarboxylase
MTDDERASILRALANARDYLGGAGQAVINGELSRALDFLNAARDEAQIAKIPVLRTLDEENRKYRATRENDLEVNRAAAAVKEGKLDYRR